MRINQNQRNLELSVKNNEFETEVRQRISEATLDLNKRYYTLMAENMSVDNADILAQFIISARRERNIAINTVMIYIIGISYLQNFHKHKELDKMDRNDIVSFLDSYRKLESVDPSHRWVNTYNIRLTAVSKFFKWLYDPKFDGTKTTSSKIRILLEKPWNQYVRRHTALTEKWKLLKSEQALRMHTNDYLIPLFDYCHSYF